jgi:MoaA/NifB/PqqE/SkfB family radical SAM enzyme
VSYAPSSRGRAGNNHLPVVEPEYVTTDNFPHTPDCLFHLQIGVTYACPCRCRHCGVSQQREHARKAKMARLSVEEIVDLCRQGKEDLHAQVVELFGGEPLAHDRIADIVEGCARHLEVWMSSNALLFDQEMARALRDRGLRRCFFSLDAPDRDSHDRNRGYPGSYDAVMRALESCEALGIDANFSTCAMANLVLGDELEKLVALTKASKARKLRLVLPKMVGGLGGDEANLLRPAEIERIRQITCREQVAYVEAEGNYSQRIEKCFCLRGHVYVSPYGTVQPCVYTQIDFGNTREAPLRWLYRRMFEHPVFADKSLLNLCLLQNPDFVRDHLSGLSASRPLIKATFDDHDDRVHRAG